MRDIGLECGAVIAVEELRTKTEAQGTAWLPFAAVRFQTECEILDSGGDWEGDGEAVRIPIQLRSIDGLIEALKQIKTELEK